MSNKLFLTAKDVSEIMSVSQSMAYRIIRTLNSELKANGYLTVCCRTSYYIPPDTVNLVKIHEIATAAI